MIENFKSYLIDSNIIIYHLNGEEIAANFLINNISSASISRLTFLEVLSYDFKNNDERVKATKLLASFTILDTNKDIASQCLLNRKNKRIKLIDNIIASTAQINNLTLVTRNEKDFKNIDVKILNIFEQDD